MRPLLLASVIAVAALGCSKSQEGGSKPSADQAKAEPKVEVPAITIDQLDAMLATGDCTPVDANGDGTRKKMGVIPGAVLLSDYETFTPAELPTDKAKPLVFYCANTHCGASHEAATRAITAGYTNVKVLPDGIAGWVKAGKKTQAL
jgi:rhodanese-related sulfurtransferase